MSHIINRYSSLNKLVVCLEIVEQWLVVSFGTPYKRLKEVLKFLHGQMSLLFIISKENQGGKEEKITRT